jgi:ribosomal protein L37E
MNTSQRFRTPSVAALGATAIATNSEGEGQVPAFAHCRGCHCGFHWENASCTLCGLARAASSGSATVRG